MASAAFSIDGNSSLAMASITSAEVDLAIAKLDGVFRGFVAGGLHRSIDTQ